MRMKLLVGLLVLALLAPCGSAWAEEGAEVDVGYRLLAPLREAVGQFVCSPLSLRLALSMAAEGAGGATREQLLAAVGDVGALDMADMDQLRSANAAIVSAEAELVPGYVAALSDQYHAALMPMAADVVAQLNEWASEQTGGMIPEVLTEAPDESTMLILLNALALDADWAAPFDPQQTQDAMFHGQGGEREVPFMYAARGMEYADAGGAQAVKLPYEGDALEMIVILPPDGGLDALLADLGERGIDAAGEFAHRGEVRLALPKLDLRSDLQLKDALIALGVQDAFTNAADFSGMCSNQELYIDQVLQRVKLDVDEQGTKAAAVTAVMMNAKGITFDSVEMTVNRPFVALVRAVDSGALLFAAVIDAP